MTTTPPGRTGRRVSSGMPICAALRRIDSSRSSMRAAAGRNWPGRRVPRI
jgi:hypothetical protein